MVEQMLYKEVKEYSNRQRINLNKNDGFTPGEEVVIFTKSEFDKYKDNILNLQNQLRTTEDKLYNIQEQQENLEQMIDKITNPIHQSYQKQLDDKDKELKQLKVQLKTLQAKTNQYNLELMGLNCIDILLLRKHKKIIKNFNDEITLLADDPKIIDADTKAIPGKDNQEQ